MFSYSATSQVIFAYVHINNDAQTIVVNPPLPPL